MVLTKPTPSVFFTTSEGRAPCPQTLSVSPHTQGGFLCLSLWAFAPLGLCNNRGSPRLPPDAMRRDSRLVFCFSTSYKGSLVRNERKELTHAGLPEAG